MPLLRAGIITDAHIPYEHKRRYATMMNCFADQRLDALYTIGDFADMYGASMHGPKHPGVLESLKDEIEAVNKRLDEIDSLMVGKKKGYVEGNHETRLERYLVEKCPALFGITEIKRILRIEERGGWSYLPFGPNQLGKVLDSNLYIRHQPAASSVLQMAKVHGANVTFGHIHRITEAWHRNIEGEQFVSFSSGWMGDARMDKIFGYVGAHNNWQNGFTMVDVDPDTKDFYHQTVTFAANDSCYFHGKIYRP